MSALKTALHAAVEAATDELEALQDDPTTTREQFTRMLRVAEGLMVACQNGPLASWSNAKRLIYAAQCAVGNSDIQAEIAGGR